MKATALVIVTCVLAAPAGAAQLYRWVDEKGRVEWRDTLPPPNAKNVERRNMSGNTIETSTLPYGVQQAMKSHPVTLWIFDCGDLCSTARAHLTRRGVPFTERDAQKESAALKKLTGALEVPVLLVGTRQLKGYLASDWDSALDAAGYLKTAIPGTTIPTTRPAEASAIPPGDTAAKAAPAK